MHSKIKKFVLIFTVFLSFAIFSINVSADEQMKGIWISTVYNLDYPNKPTTDSNQLKAEADQILDKCKDMGFNNIFLQVRPNSDALYKSSIYPWSAYLTGQQGVAPDNNFDPLQYWIDGAHSRGMKLHAWINPYRATKISNSSENALLNLSQNNPAIIHPNYVIKYSDGNYYYDPALPAVRQLVIDGIKEIVNNYNVDGIHMDDYFYPGTDFNDDTSFQQYGSDFADKGDWRRNNVNLLICDIADAINAINPNVEFGISPAGIWANKQNNPLGSDTAGNEAYYSHYADTRKWALDGTVDYIAPQIYWEIGHAKADYATLTKWWAETLKDAPAKLYIGLADYKSNDVKNSADPWYDGNEIQKQLINNSSFDKIDGEIHFRYKMIINNPGLVNKIKQAYNGKNDIIATTEASTELTTQQTSKPETKPENKNIQVIVDGKYIEFDQQPVIENSRTLVPMRAIFEALGANVEWYNNTQSVIAENTDGKRVTLVIGSKNMLVNNKDIVTLDVPAKIMGNRTMIPLRAVSEAFDCTVEWDGNNRIVKITK